MSDVKYLSLVDDVCRSKFTYVVASQVGAEGDGGRPCRGTPLLRLRGWPTACR